MGEATAEIEVHKSRFIALAGPLADIDEVKSLVAEARAAHPGSTHVVWAFLVGDGGERLGSNDDREPKGTAGRPLLEVLKGSGITNALIRVVRYFGGTKLGTGGLVKAYTTAGQRVIERLPTEQLVHRERFRVVVEYRHYDFFLALARQQGAVIRSSDFATCITVAGAIAEDSRELFDSAVLDLTGGAARPVYDETDGEAR